MQLAGCNRSIAHPITLVRARHGKSFVSPSSRPLVIALSVNARLAPAACIIKLPACRNADRSLLARTSYTTHATSTRAHACTHASLSPSLFHSSPPFHLSLRRRPRKREGAPTHDRVSSTLSASTLHPSTQFPLTLIYLNYILRASAGGRVCAPVPTRAATRHDSCVRAADSYACEGASVWTR